jgi:hypothetical protein
MQRALVASGVAGIADNGEDGLVSALRVDGHEVADLRVSTAGVVAAHDVVDVAGVDVAPWIPLVIIGYIGEGGLRDVVAGEGVFRTLQDGVLLVVQEVADDLPVGLPEIVRVDKDVEGRFARRPVPFWASYRTRYR